ncbi:hypothetical protein [Bradyrhizobium erythrophlei]|uniref:Uncharacterized protein n=1 Tax=Bradyrhizobium erythrophlei TaxID=1437360 RepID=A0A1M5V6Y9_9BRAD|nr:hypothetical protein [Bradyrhizobium erythrophlei]SHH70986.1 hypothetical protein SAMN05443248_5803 [Bradyrhizobium erythrophlei]
MLQAAATSTYSTPHLELPCSIFRTSIRFYSSWRAAGPPNLELRQDRHKLNEVLTMNSTVLDGSRSPRSVPTKRTYGSFYAVVTATKVVPPNWRLVFQNRQYALYEVLAK